MAGSEHSPKAKLAHLKDLLGEKYTEEVMLETLAETSGDVQKAYDQLSEYTATPGWTQAGKKKPASAAPAKSARGSAASTSSSSSTGGRGRGGAPRGRDGKHSSASRDSRSSPSSTEHRGARAVQAPAAAVPTEGQAPASEAAARPEPASQAGVIGAPDRTRSSGVRRGAPQRGGLSQHAPRAPRSDAAAESVRKDSSHGQRGQAARGRLSRETALRVEAAAPPAPTSATAVTAVRGSWANIVKSNLPTPQAPVAQEQQPAQASVDSKIQEAKAEAPTPTTTTQAFNPAPAPEVSAYDTQEEQPQYHHELSAAEPTAEVPVPSVGVVEQPLPALVPTVVEAYNPPQAFFESDLPLFTSTPEGFNEAISDNFRFGSFIEEPVQQQDHQQDKREGVPTEAVQAQLPPAQPTAAQQLQAATQAVAAEEPKSGVRAMPAAASEMFPHPYFIPQFPYPSGPYPDSPLPGAPTSEGGSSPFHYMPPPHVYYPYGIPPPYSYPNQYRPAPGPYFPPKFPAGVHHPFPSEEMGQMGLASHIDYQAYPGYAQPHTKVDGSEIAHPQQQNGQPPASHSPSRFDPTPYQPYGQWAAPGQHFS